eukprot:365443-Chlamydomonas_euryale.AAC.31
MSLQVPGSDEFGDPWAQSVWESLSLMSLEVWNPTSQRVPWLSESGNFRARRVCGSWGPMSLEV